MKKYQCYGYKEFADLVEKELIKYGSKNYIRNGNKNFEVDDLDFQHLRYCDYLKKEFFIMRLNKPLTKERRSKR